MVAVVTVPGHAAASSLDAASHQSFGEHSNSVAPVLGARSMIGDRTARRRDQFGESIEIPRCNLERGEVDRRCEMLFRLGTSQHGRPDRAERDRHAQVVRVEYDAGAGHRDHHGIAHADLGVPLPPGGQRQRDRHDHLRRHQCRSLHADHEVTHPHRPTSRRRCELDGRIERSQHGQTVARRRACREIAAERRGVADLR